ncbi:MAG: hypothetical protein O7H39_16275 [Gammaproteobacteria bacterium]|nr:hypothetical protein [Gammaproteobacteria bacterium]
MKRLLFFAALAALTSGAGELERIAAITHPDLAEMSGIVASSYPGVFWVHNDSGDSPRIFAIRPDAGIVVPGFIRVMYPDRTPDDWPGYTIDNAWNSDWEDIALDAGVLYLADVGNNGNARRDLGVYVVNEFPPDAVHKARAAKFLGIRYPDQSEYPAKLWHFDCEAVFTFDGKLYFLTKHRQPGKHTEFERGTKLYRLDSAFTDQDNVLTLIDKHDGLTLPTGADVSPDGQHLAIVTYQRLWVFERPRRGDKWLQSTPQVLDFDRDVVKQNEAIGWESNDSLLMTNENREIFRIPLSALTEG